jgi:hypothetical protein
LSILLIAVFDSIKATFDDASVNKISKDVAQKYQKLLEEEREYDVDKLTDVRECDSGELEFLTTWKGYDDCTWEKIDTFNGPLSEYCISFFVFKLFFHSNTTNHIPGFIQQGKKLRDLLSDIGIIMKTKK